LSKSPGHQSGKYAQHIDAKLRTRLKNFRSHKLKVPLHKRRTLGRKVYDVPVLAPYEELEDEVSKDLTFTSDLHDAIQTRQLPQLYFDHPVVTQHADEEVVPIGLFTDGVEFQKKDTCIAIWLYTLITKVRHLLIVFKKSQLCKCGCRGWCSVWVALDYLRYCLLALADGVFPLHPYGREDIAHFNYERAGSALLHKYCLVEIKTDWAEHGTTLALATWANSLFPCVHCNVEKWAMCCITSQCAVELPWEATSMADYDAACARAETPVTLASRDDLGIIRASLRRTLHTKKMGRVIIANIDRFALLRGDVLVPSPDLADTFALESITVYPTRIMFWRGKAATFATRRNPLMSVIGITLKTFCIDVLHCVWLGVAQVWLVFALWLLIQGNPFSFALPGGGLRNELSMERLRDELIQYYKRRAVAKETQVQDFRIGALGTPNDHARQPFKGAEAKHLVGFVVDALERHREHIDGDRHTIYCCLVAGQQLRMFIKLTDGAPDYPDTATSFKITAAGVSHIVHAKAAGVDMIPKHHQFLHLLFSQDALGNPRRHANWVDESLNKNLAAIAGKAHSQVWEARILCVWGIHKTTKELERCGRTHCDA